MVLALDFLPLLWAGLHGVLWHGLWPRHLPRQSQVLCNL